MLAPSTRSRARRGCAFWEIVHRPAPALVPEEAGATAREREVAMPGHARLTDKVTVGGQPTVDELRELRAQGFVAVVNLRTDGEAGQPLSPESEGFAAHEVGLAYHHLPVALPQLDPDHVRCLRDAIQAAPGPVYVHCGAGQRACALGLLATAESATRGETLLASAAAAGLPIQDQRLGDFVREQAERTGWSRLQAV
jgi:uncharacterized protein (TIGR01244 family)